MIELIPKDPYVHSTQYWIHFMTNLFVILKTSVRLLVWDSNPCVITVCIFLLMDVAFREGEVMDLVRLWHSRNNWLSIDCLIKGPKHSLPGKQSPHTLQSVCRWQVLRWASAFLVEIFHLLDKVTFSSLYLSCLSERVPTAASNFFSWLTGMEHNRIFCCCNKILNREMLLCSLQL